MHKYLPIYGLSLAFIASSVEGTILTSPRSAYYVGAIVVFNVTDKYGNTVREGSTSPEEEVGKYGSSSPDKNVSGVIVRAVDGFGRDYGCKESYKFAPDGVQYIWIALVQRGKCTFSEKIVQASRANASAIIIYDKQEDVVIMSHDGAADIVSVIIPQKLGREIAKRVDAGDKVTASIKHGEQYWTPPKDKTSIIFVSLSFLILMVISLTWLIVYYVQRFRLVQAPDVIKQRREHARRLVNTLEKKLLKADDKEIENEEICPICIENYRVDDILRIAPCNHIFHRKCVDPWLRSRETCPMCKFDVLKSLGLPPLALETGLNFRTTRTVADVWEQESRQETADVLSNSTESLVQGTQEQTILVAAEGPQVGGEAETTTSDTHCDSANDSANVSPCSPTV